MTLENFKGGDERHEVRTVKKIEYTHDIFNLIQS